MLGYSHTPTLAFPHLKFIRNAKDFKSYGSKKDEGCPIYKLDWSKKEKKDEEEFHRWIQKRFDENNEKMPDYTWIGSLPEKYDTFIKNMEFAIPHHYKRQILRHSKEGGNEWDYDDRGFDTFIRELCLKPAKSHIEVAMALIADCRYDSETNYFYKGDMRILIKPLLIYKFWSSQTGRGLLKYNARIDELEKHWVKEESKHSDFEKNKIVVSELVKELDAHNKSFNELYALPNILFENQSEANFPPE